MMSYQVTGEAGHEWTGIVMTAIAKLAPNAVIAPGLSIHYSGGASLEADIAGWLAEQEITNGDNH